MVVLGYVGTESFLSSLRSWMAFWKVVRLEKFHPFWPNLEKRMNLKIRPFSNESVLGEFRRFLVIGKKFKFSRRINSDSYISRMNLDGTDVSWKSSIQPRFVRFCLNRLNHEKTDVFTRIILSQKNVRSAWLAVEWTTPRSQSIRYTLCEFAVQRDVRIFLERYVWEIWVT